MKRINLNEHLIVCMSFCFFVLFSCRQDTNHTTPKKPSETPNKTNHKVEKQKTAESQKVAEPIQFSKETDTARIITNSLRSDVKMSKNEAIPSQWQEITTENGLKIDIKYAGDDNFTNKKIYDCARCFLRPEAVAALIEVQHTLQDSFGYSLKLFDCFRPQLYQQRLWDAMPNADYVTPPSKGSMHSRGLAVDLTIIDQHGEELKMGTAYDHLGKEAHIDYVGHKPQVYKNRDLLKRMMEKHGFKGIRTEWWHYSFRGKSYPLDSWVWPCPK